MMAMKTAVKFSKNTAYQNVEGERESTGGSNPLPPPLLKKNSFLNFPVAKRVLIPQAKRQLSFCTLHKIEAIPCYPRFSFRVFYGYKTVTALCRARNIKAL